MPRRVAVHPGIHRAGASGTIDIDSSALDNTGGPADISSAGTVNDDFSLVNSAVDADGLDAEVTRYTDMLARGGPRALAATKAMLRRDRGEHLQQDLEAMLALSSEFFASEEGQEGMAAFAEKRAPSWVPGG